MPEGTKSNYFMDKLDEIQEEYAKLHKFENNNSDLYIGKTNDDRGNFNCRFKGECYTFKTNSGNCPCGLEG